MENLIDREFRGMQLKTMKKLFNYDQKTNSSVFSWFADFRDRLIFPYKIAVKFSKIANYFQAKNNFDENSTWRTLKYTYHEIQNNKVKSFSKLEKF